MRGKYIYGLKAALQNRGVLPESVNNLSKEKKQNTVREFLKFKSAENRPVTHVLPYGFLSLDDNCGSNSSLLRSVIKSGFTCGSAVKIISGHDNPCSQSCHGEG